MTSPEPQMKPTDVIVYKLGELGGQLTGVQTSVSQAAAIQAADSAENKKEHAEFRKTLGEHTTELSALKQSQPIKVSPWSKAGVIIALPASVIALIGFITLYLAPH